MAENDEQKISSCENNGGNSNGYEVSLFSVKEEPLIFPYEHDDNHGGEDGWLPKPIEGLREIGPPPFLMKTFKMVDDPSTDLIISWSPTKTSFVVWDPHKFSTGVLPKHFKHSNFSSFVRQLNTYSFRKIDSDRWEFANEGFQKGKKHLLKLIKRRKPNSQNFQQQKSWLNSISHGVEAEFEKLKTDQNTLKMEVLKLRQQQENTQHYLAAVKERLNTTETKQKHLTLFLIKFLENPVFLQHLTKKMETRQTLNSGEKILKKIRFSATNLEVDMKKAVDTGEIASSSSDAKTVCSDIWTLFSSGGSRAENSSGTNSVDACSENFVLWEKLMDDDMINEDNEAVASKQQLDIDLELENLISSKSLEHDGCLASIA